MGDIVQLNGGEGKRLEAVESLTHHLSMAARQGQTPFDLSLALSVARRPFKLTKEELNELLVELARAQVGNPVFSGTL